MKAIVGWKQSDHKHSSVYMEAELTPTIEAIPAIGDNLRFTIPDSVSLAVFDAMPSERGHGIGRVSSITHDFTKVLQTVTFWLEDVELKRQ